MNTVNDILDSKGREVFSIGPEPTVFEALTLMSDKRIGGVLVVEDNRAIGILTERDYARKVVLLNRDSRETRVREIMTPNPVCVRPEQTIEECMALMTAKRIRHLPVVSDGQLVGLISIGDAVKAKISEQEFVIQQLENYISGGAGY